MLSIAEEIASLYAADQAARRHHPPFGSEAYLALRRDDATRRARARELLPKAGALPAITLFHAAMLFQHGDALEDLREAHEFAGKAAASGYRPARWLAAATLDRWLMLQGLPQKYGTQVVPDGRRQRVWDTDPATSDADRLAWDVPPMREMEEYAEKITREEPMPNLDQAPDWLKAAIERWNRQDGRSP
ncbi:MAG TPA: hypothetical protein VFV17_00930 [Usitatibacteraceae bacterium]|nr:hypothetical protein [Usitatibacteraceae bacterium]